MALASTMFRFELEISDVDRGVYTTEELRIAQHPSETASYLIARVLAYALEHCQDLSMGRGVSFPDEPGLSAPNNTGGVGLWIEIGLPSAERLHKVTKSADTVKLYTHRGMKLVTQELTSRRVHRLDEVDIVELPVELIAQLEERLDRRSAWTILRSDGVLYVTVGGETLSGPLNVHRLQSA